MTVQLQMADRRSLSAVDEELQRVFALKLQRAETYGPWFEQLWAAARRCSRGGKLVRPRIFLAALAGLGADAVSSPDAEHAQESGIRRIEEVRVAAAIELLHYSFLLHDDVIDGDLTRRGRPNLIAVLADAPLAPRGGGSPARSARSESERRLHWARSGAILLGDLLLSEVHQIFASLRVGEEARTDLLALLDHAITESVAGEQLDVGLGDGVIASEPGIILEMCRLKTGTYTFELPLRAAAVLAAAPPSLGPALSRIGRLLGLAFQLQDDLLSVFGDPAVHGKDAFSDIREGKETALVSYARRTPAWTRIAPSFGRPDLRAAEAKEVAAAFEACGARTFVQSSIDDLLVRIHEEIEGGAPLIPAPVAAVLSDIAAELEGRAS